MRNAEWGKYSVPSSRINVWRGVMKLFHNLPADEVSLDDPLEHRRRAGVVPSPFGVDDRDGAAGADLQAVGFGAEDAAVAGEFEFLEAPLQVIPRLEARLLVDALRLGLIGAEEQVTLNLVSTDGGEFGPRG